MDESGPAVILEPAGAAVDERSYGGGYEIDSMKEAESRAAQKQKEEQKLKDELEKQLRDEQQKEKELADALEAEKLARAKAEEKVQEQKRH